MFRYFGMWLRIIRKGKDASKQHCNSILRLQDIHSFLCIFICLFLHSSLHLFINWILFSSIHSFICLSIHYFDNLYIHLYTYILNVLIDWNVINTTGGHHIMIYNDLRNHKNNCVFIVSINISWIDFIEIDIIIYIWYFSLYLIII